MGGSSYKRHSPPRLPGAYKLCLTLAAFLLFGQGLVTLFSVQYSSSRQGGQQLIPPLTWQHTIPERQRQAGLGVIAYDEATALFKFIQKLHQADGPPINIVALGGRTCARPANASSTQDATWVDLAVNMLHAWAPGAVIFVQNMCASGVHPLHAAIFLHKLLPQAVDLVLLDFLPEMRSQFVPFNNTATTSYELLLRRLLRWPARPAVLQVFAPPAWNATQPYQYTATHEDAASVLSQYYRVPWVSLRDALWHSTADEVPVAAASIVRPDGVQYNDLGATMAADLVATAFANVVQLSVNPAPGAPPQRDGGGSGGAGSFIMSPLHTVGTPPLPRLMYPLPEGDLEIVQAMMPADLAALARGSTGWKPLVGEAGWRCRGTGAEATDAGLPLVLQSVCDVPGAYDLLIGCLTADVGMARVDIACDGSCSCPETTVDATNATLSQPVLSFFHVPVTAEVGLCSVSITRVHGVGDMVESFQLSHFALMRNWPAHVPAASLMAAPPHIVEWGPPCGNNSTSTDD